jgi:hypothetical protein
MPRFAPDADDITLITDRLRLGLPLRGFDGRDIPLYDADGCELDPVDAAHALLFSGASLLPADQSDAYIEVALARAAAVEAASVANGDEPAMVAAKVTAVLVSAAVRATVISNGRDVSPTALNRATLSWYQLQEMHRAELLEASFSQQERPLSA